MTTTSITSSGYRRHTTNRRHVAAAQALGVTVLEIATLIAIVVLLVVGVVVTSGRVHAQGPTTRIFVDSGDTAWTIASRHPVPGQTTQQTAEQIAQLNSLDTAGLPAKTAIEIPVTPHTESVLACR